MKEYSFSVIVPLRLRTDQEILDATDALGEAGCDDASLCGHPEGIEIAFDRKAESLQEAIVSAVTAVESIGYQVARVEMERGSIVR